MFKKLYEVLTKIIEKFFLSIFVIMVASGFLLGLALIAFVFVFGPIDMITKNRKEKTAILSRYWDIFLWAFRA